MSVAGFWLHSVNPTLHRLSANLRRSRCLPHPLSVATDSGSTQPVSASQASTGRSKYPSLGPDHEELNSDQSVLPIPSCPPPNRCNASSQNHRNPPRCGCHASCRDPVATTGSSQSSEKQKEEWELFLDQKYVARSRSDTTKSRGARTLAKPLRHTVRAKLRRFASDL